MSEALVALFGILIFYTVLFFCTLIHLLSNRCKSRRRSRKISNTEHTVASIR